MGCTSGTEKYDDKDQDTHHWNEKLSGQVNVSVFTMKDFTPEISLDYRNVKESNDFMLQILPPHLYAQKIGREAVK